MADEEDGPACRLTYEEGKRIRREAEKPYDTRIVCCMTLSFILMAVTILCNDWRFGVLWTGRKGIEERVLDGDLQAVLDLFTYNSTMDLGILIMLGGLLIAGYYAILGERAARKALAEANEEKDERWTRG